MRRFIVVLVLTLTTVTVALFPRTVVPQSPTKSSENPPSSRPLILQESDGEHLVRRAGPTGGWPFTIKLDGENGNTEDFVVLTETMAPGQIIPFHKHDNAEEILFLEEGGATVIVGDQRAVAGPGRLYSYRVTPGSQLQIQVRKTSIWSLRLRGMDSRNTCVLKA